MHPQSVRAGSLSMGRARQRGAFSVLAASAMVVSLTMVALAVDSGRLFYQQGQVQGAADAAAVAAVSEYAEGDNAGDREAALAAAQAVVDGSLNNVEDVSLQFGRVESEDGRLVFHPDDEGMAIQVDIVQSTPMSLVAGWIWPDDASLTGDAVAEQPRIIALQAGSAVADLDSDESPVLDVLLGGLIGAGGEVSIISYEGLTATRISLRELAEAQAGVGSVEELLELRLSLSEFVNLLARVAPGGSSAEIDLNNLSARVSQQLDVRLGDIIELGVGDESAAAAAEIDIFSLIQLSAMAANRDSGSGIELDVSSLDGLLSTLGLAELELTLSIIEAPQVAIGRSGQDPSGEWRTEVDTGQLLLETELSLGDILSSLVAAEASLDLELGGSSARAEGIGQGADGSEVIVQADSDIAMGEFQAVVREDLLTGAVLAEVDAWLPLASDGEELLFTPDYGPEHGQSVGTSVAGALMNLNEADFNVSLLGLDASLESDLINEILRPLLSDLGELLLDPLLASLGLNTGTGEISVNEVRAGSPRLVQ